MSCTDFHLRHLIKTAALQRSHDLLDDAFAIIKDNFDRFGEDFSPELLVLFAEVASDLCGREDAVMRVLELYDRLSCADDQFKVRALLIRCVYEARLGSETCQLKGMHLLQQLQFALSFLMKGLAIATRLSDRYGFLTYNASLVFWTVVRPICRMGWQRHIVAETTDVLEKLKAVVAAAGGAGGGKGGGKGGGATLIPTMVDTTWLVELTLNLAFGLEDAGKDPDAAKQVDEAYKQYEEMLKQNPDAEAKDPQFRLLILNARAHFVRKQAVGPQGVVRTDIEKLRGSSLMGTALLVRNGGIPKETCEDELIKTWSSVDTDFNLAESRDKFKKEGKDGMANDKADARGANLKPQKLVDLALALRAACAAECWGIAQPMLFRVDKFKIPPGRGRILVDLSKVEIEVWQAKNIRQEDPTSKMLLTPEEQSKVEVNTRSKGVRLCEQCIMAANRINEVDLVEDSAVTMWNIAREMMCDGQRQMVHKSLLKCIEILDEVQSVRLARLRVQLHFEVACCEISQDLLTKGCAELDHAQAIDYTVAESELSDPIKQRLIVNDEGVGSDPASYTRRFDAPVDQQAHLLKWKLSLYADPTDAADQVMLLLDQVRQQSSRRINTGDNVTHNLLVRALTELEIALEDLSPEELQKMSRTFAPPARVINSDDAMVPLPHQAPATVKDAEIDSKPPLRIQDQRPRSEYEDAVVRLKRIVMLMCKISIEAYKAGQIEFSLKVARRTMGILEGDLQFGPPPIEVEGALLQAEMAYTRALCLAKELEDIGVIMGIDEEIPKEVNSEDVMKEHVEGQEELEPELTPEEKASANDKKRELIEALIFGMEKSYEFKQYWSVANGLAHWWNLHLELVELSLGQPEYLKRALSEYRDGFRKMLKFFYGEAALPDSDFDHRLVANLVLAFVNASVGAKQPQLDALDIDKLLVLKRLGGNERKEIMARVTELCKTKEKALKPEDLIKIKLDRLEAAPAGAPAAKAKAAPKGAADAAPPEDRSDLQGREAEVMMLAASVPYAPNHDEGKKLVDQAVAVLNAWEPRKNDEVQLTLWIELWTRLGRQCLGKPMNLNVGSKYALMCGIKGLGKVDAPIPKHASVERLRWRGACHSLCGEVFLRLVDPQKQEKESVLKLRSMSVEQFERCCHYAFETKNATLAIFGARSLWNVSLPLQHSAETRQTLRGPLLTATRALAAVKYAEDPYFFVGLYAALFDCYSDSMQWDGVHEMLGEAFAAVPAICHRRLWALRMLALSKQGKNVVIAMGKMKESQAKAQAGIWLVLARASSKRTDQLDAYMNAVRILQEAQQADVVEVRLELADWMLRNGFEYKIAQDQLLAAAEVLLEIEEDLDDEDLDCMDGDGVEGMSLDQSDAHSRVSFHSRRSSRRSSRSDVGSARRKSQARKSISASRRSRSNSSVGSDMKRRRSRTGSVRSSRSAASRSSRQKRAEEDQELSEQLYAHHYEALTRIYATNGRLNSGAELHSALLAAAHFAVRFFACTVEMANKAVQASAEREEAPASRSRAGSKMGSQVFARSSTKDQKNGDPVVPAFFLPEQLADWANLETWPWHPCPLMSEIWSSAEHDDSCTWAGNSDTFVKPPISFHTLCRLENDLEEHGYHLWVFPVLALHLQLADAFASPIQEAVACLVYMRLSRFASACRLTQAAAAAAVKWNELFSKIKQTFGTFGEELELVRSQRAGRGTSNTLDLDWLDSGGLQQQVSAPWSCSDLNIHEVWAEVCQECFLHGELWMACRLAEEAAAHAKVYGDRRTLRSIEITRARIALCEGKHEDAARALNDITACDLEQTVDVALILSRVYIARLQPVLMDEVLDGASKVIKASANVANGTNAEYLPTSCFVRAECDVGAARVLAEVKRLSFMPVASRDWLDSLNNVFATQREMSERLVACALYRRGIVMALAFFHATVDLLAKKRQELAANASLSVTNGGVLTCEVFVDYAEQLCDMALQCHRSRDALLAATVPLEGAKAGVVYPTELLVAKLDTWEARVGSVLREFTAAVGIEQKQRDVLIEVAALSKADFTELPRLSAGKVLQVVRAWPEEDTGIDPIEQFAADWKEEQERLLAEKGRVSNTARAATTVERSIAMVSNAVSTLQSMQFSRDEGADGSVGQSGRALSTATEVEALVELGRLQLERAKKLPIGANLVPAGTPSKWEEPLPDARELRCLELGERYSNILQNKDPNDLYKVPPEAAGEGGVDEDKPQAVEGGGAEEEEIPFEEMAKATLCEALQKAISSRHLSCARRALQALALDAYGVQCPEATFEFLAWLQSVDVCINAEEVLLELVPNEHQELVQMSLLRRLEETWIDPMQLRAYEATTKRLCHESPFFQRHRLADLPAVNDLLLSYFPPLTLVVTLQLHGDFLYVGAASTPPEGDQQQRLSQIQRHVTRMPVILSELHAYLLKIKDLNSAIEKEFIIAPELGESLSNQFDWILSHLDAWIVQPLVKELATNFWPYTIHLEHPNNPKQLVLLPDSALWGFPFERCPSFASLFHSTCHAAISRDLSMHLAAQRVRHLVEPADGSERKPLRAMMSAFRLDTTSLLTDPFLEDVLKASDDPKTETMSMLHDRLVNAKIVGSANRSVHGQMFTASPQDVKGMLIDSSALLSLGFSRFFGTMPARHFASQDLRRLSLLGLFSRCINDASFRRQTKTDSAKTLRQQAAESSYGVVLLASFRGVQSIVMVSAPVPIALATRNIEVFSRALHGGKTVAKAVEEILFQHIKDPSLRFLRAKEGGELPPEARSGGGVASDGKDAKRPPAESPVASEEYLLPLHTRAAYSIIGAPWLFGESGPEGGGKKK